MDPLSLPEETVLRGYHRLLVLVLALCTVLVILVFYLGVESGRRCKARAQQKVEVEVPPSQVVNDVFGASQPRRNEIPVDSQPNGAGTKLWH